MIKCALFDLDGTLVDTSADLGRATAWVLERFGREPKWTDTDYRAFVGNGARLLLDRFKIKKRKACGCNKQTASIGFTYG